MSKHDLRQFRPLPSLYLRKAWPYWEDDEGDLLEFSEDGLTFDWHTIGCFRPGLAPKSRWFDVDRLLPETTFQPACGTWAEVEALAASLSAPGAER